MMAARVEASEAQSQIYAARLAESEEAMERLVFQSREREDSLRDEVARLQGTIEAQQLASNVAEETLRHMVSRERKESERLRHERDQALRQRWCLLPDAHRRGRKGIRSCAARLARYLWFFAVLPR